MKIGIQGLGRARKSPPDTVFYREVANLYLTHREAVDLIEDIKAALFTADGCDTGFQAGWVPVRRSEHIDAYHVYDSQGFDVVAGPTPSRRV